MNNSINTNSHKQFKQKHQQLSELTGKVEMFMLSYNQTHKSNNNNHVKMKLNLKNKMMVLRDGLQSVKQDFGFLKEDLVTYSGLSTEVVRMAAEMPQVYQTAWGKLQAELKSRIYQKNAQCEQLKNELSTKTDQINDLKIKLQVRQQRQQFNLTQNLSSISLFNPSKQYQQNNDENVPKQQIKTQYEQNQRHHEINDKKSQLPVQIDNNKALHHTKLVNTQNTHKRNSATTSQQAIINKQIEKNVIVQQQNYSQFDDYINSMEITIRESEGALFRKITQQGSLEQQDQEQEDSISFEYHNKNKHKTARPHLILDSLDNDKERNKSLRQCSKAKQSESSFINNQSIIKSNQTSQKSAINTNPSDDVLNINKHIFWNKLSKTLRNPSKSQTRRGSLSQSKQNIDNREHSNKLSALDKKVLTSKITDFRKILFAQKGIQRLAFKM